ncbi:MAG: hypothetical protein ACXV5B_08310 [Halobacteriota archaeon]
MLRDYENEWKGTVGKTLKRMYKAKEFIVNRSDDDINRIAHALHGVQVNELSLKGVTLRLRRKDPRLLLMLRHLLS